MKKSFRLKKTLVTVVYICAVLGCIHLIGCSKTKEYLQDGSISTMDSEKTDLQNNHDQKNDVTQNMEAFRGNQTSYEAIYASMNEVWQEQNAYVAMGRDYFGLDGVAEVEEAVEEEAEAPVEEAPASADMSAAPMLEDSASNSSYGTTNVQTVGVDEGDIVKNDGRYLYQIITKNDTWPQEQTIQIVDTQGGLREISRIEGFEAIEEFYIWEDLLIAIENKYLDVSQESAEG